MGTYSYNPSNITAGGVDQMRFELGDTVIDGGALTSPLCNEEYNAIINSGITFKRAKLKILEAIVMKLSYEVTTSVDGLSYSLDSRAERWRQMLKEMKAENKVSVPVALKGAIYGKTEEHYFHEDLHKNNL